MKSFFEEYGFVILAAIVVVILIAMATPLGSLVKSQITSIVDSLGSKTQSKLNATDGIIQVRVSTANNKITLEWDAIKKEDKFKYQYKASNTSKDANWTDIKPVDNESNKSRKVEISTDSSGANLTNKTKVEYKIYDSNDVLVASGIVIAKINFVDNDVNEGISKTDSFVGYYADTNGDGTVDGIIFADLAVGGSGVWNPSGDSHYNHNPNGTYSYSAIPVGELKNYTTSQNSYSGKFGDKPVLKAKGSGKDRFYVMALEDIDSNRYIWYNAASDKMDDYASTTSVDFGTGKQNTINMIEKWNNKAYGAQNTDSGYKDMWGKITNNDWFVPSRAEWAAFGSNLGVTKTNYASLGLPYGYWSSSQRSRYGVHYPSFNNGYMDTAGVNNAAYVRLATTF